MRTFKQIMESHASIKTCCGGMTNEAFKAGFQAAIYMLGTEECDEYFFKYNGVMRPRVFVKWLTNRMNGVKNE